MNASNFTSTGYHGFAAMYYIPLTSIWGLVASIACIIYTITRLNVHKVVKNLLLIMGLQNVCAFLMTVTAIIWIQVETITNWGSCVLLFLPFLSALAGTWLLTASISVTR